MIQKDIAPAHGAIEHHSKIFFRSALNQPTINYYFTNDISSPDEKVKGFYPFERPIPIRETSVLLPIGLVNAGHAQCQIIGYYNMLANNSSLGSCRLCVSSLVKTYMPFVYDLLVILFGEDRLTVLDNTATYFFPSVWLLQARYQLGMKKNSVIVKDYEWYQKIHLPRNPAEAYVEDPSCILNAANAISKDPDNKWELYTKIIFVKTGNQSGRMNSPSRAMKLTPSVIELLVERGYKILSLGDFEDLRHCIATLHSAEKVITSWGNIATFNRFFYNTKARVVLLGNQSYSKEYQVIPKDGFFPIAAFPVEEQFVVRDFPDSPKPAEVEKILALLEP